jgi:hypothetical protein
MTTSTLNTTDDGRGALTVAAQYLLQRRLSRFFKRNLVIDYNYWLQTGEFPLTQLLGQLNGLNDQEILDLYHLLGSIGGLQTSIANTTIYVNAVTGSDNTGTGSAAAPYASLWFLDLIPRRLNHKYRIVLMSNINEPSRTLNFNFDFGENGSFALIGHGAPTVIESNTIGTLGILTGGGGQWIACTAAFGPNAQSSFLVDQNYAVPIHKIHAAANALVNLYPLTFSPAAPGDPISVVRPAITLQVKNIVAKCSGGRRVRQSQLGIYNLNIDFPTAVLPYFSPVEPIFVWENHCDSTISFTRFTNWNGSGSNPGNSIRFGNLNMNVALDWTEIHALAACGIINLDAPDTITVPYDSSICGAKFGDIAVAHGIDLSIRDCAVMSIDIDCIADLKNSSIDVSSARSLVCNQSVAKINTCMLDGIVTPAGLKNRGGIEAYDAVLYCGYCTTLVSDNCIALHGNTRARIEGCGSDATYSTISDAGLFWRGINIAEMVYDNAGGVTPVSERLFGTLYQICANSESVGNTNVNWAALDVVLNMAAAWSAGTIMVSK